jgi:hypothetical protein
MQRDRLLEQQKCPRCWIGILYNTGTKMTMRPHSLYYQCCHCGRLIARDAFKKLMSGSIFIAPSGPSGPPVSPRRMERKRQMMKPPETEPGFVVGIIRDLDSGKPVGNAYVFIRGMPLETFTNRYGQYSLEAVPPGKIVLGIWRQDYRNIVKQIEDVKPCQIKALNFRIRRLRQAPVAFPALIHPWEARGKKTADWGVHGFVRDLEDNPIRAALIMLLAPGRIYITQTDSTGHYEILNIVPAGSYPVRANADGFAYRRKAVMLKKGLLAGCDFRLRAA